MTPDKDMLKNEIYDILIKAGIPVKIKGFKFFEAAIMLNLEDPQAIDNMTMMFYPTLAKQFDTKPKRVERNMRYGLDDSYKKNKLQKFMPSCENDGKPTNGEFILFASHEVSKNYTEKVYKIKSTEEKIKMIDAKLHIDQLANENMKKELDLYKRVYGEIK